jgi:YgiT-type zinc finger domain-containing protein
MSKQASSSKPPAARRRDGGGAGGEPAGPACSACGRSNLVQGSISTVFQDGDAWAVIRDIPAMICPDCREEFIDDDTAVRLDMMRANGFSSQEPAETVTVPVFVYRRHDGTRA